MRGGRRDRLSGLCGLLALVALVSSTPASGKQADAATLPDHVRDALGPTDRLSLELGRGSFVDVDAKRGGIAFLGSTEGFIEDLQRPTRAGVLDFVDEHRRALGLDREDVESLDPSTSYTSPDGVRHLVWAQSDGGIDSYDTHLAAHMTAEGELINVSGAPVGDYAVPDRRPAVRAREALSIARDEIGSSARLPKVVRRSPAADAETTFAGNESARLVGFAGRSRTKLAWRVDAADRRGHRYVIVVDAEHGEIIARRTLTRFVNSAQVWSFHPDQRATPLSVNLGTDPTWINRSASGTLLRGNNVHAVFEAGSSGTQPFEEVDQVGGNWSFPVQYFNQSECPAFGCTWNNSVNGTTVGPNRDQATTNLFYLVNRFHDYLLQPPVGFNEASLNFEHVNSSGQGVGGDAVDAFADMRRSSSQGAFAVVSEQDGETPLINMGPWHNPYDVHSANSADVVYHEYSHLLVSRLLSPGLLSANQTAAMDEGWADFFAMDALVHEGRVADTAADAQVFFGSYVENGFGPFGPEPGIRRQAIDCEVTASAADCPGTPGGGSRGFTYGDLGRIGTNPAQPHDNGEIWGETLWDLRERFGHQTALALIAGGLRLSPSRPSYLDARDAILQQAQVLGIPTQAVWEVFAKRGMGVGADDGGSGNSLNVVQNFSTPGPSGPSILFVSPSEGAPSAARTGFVIAAFDRSMNKPSAEAAFSLKRTSNGAAVSGSFGWYGNALIFAPASPLTGGANYTATMGTGARDLAGNPLAAAKTWQFTVADQPLVIFVQPGDGTTGAPRGYVTVAAFDKPMDKPSAEAAFSLRRTSTGAPVIGSFGWYGNALIFAPANPLEATTQYTASIGGSARDLAGNALGNPTTWRYTTGTALIGPGAAFAATAQYPTVFTKFKYELSGGDSQFKGKVDSSKGGCVPDRKVVLYRKRNGEKKKLGGDRTNNKGKFVIDLGSGAPKNGTYYATVNKAKVGDSGDKTCLARTSPSVKLS